MKTFILSFFSLCCMAGYAQNDCRFFDDYIHKGDSLLYKVKKPNFQSVINAYNTAMLHCPEKAQEARNKILNVFIAIEKLKLEAEELARIAIAAKKDVEKERKNALDSAAEAKRQRGIAEAFSKVSEYERKNALDSAAEAKRQRGIAEEALNKALIAQMALDSSNKKLESSNKKLQYFSSTAIGAKYKGGVIAWKDSTGEHGLIAAVMDMPGRYSWDSAKIVCDKYPAVIEGDSTYGGWRLPDKVDLNKLFVNKDVVGGFSRVSYWSSKRSNYPNNHWFQRFWDNGHQYYNFNYRKKHVRAVRDF